MTAMMNDSLPVGEVWLPCGSLDTEEGRQAIQTAYDAYDAHAAQLLRESGGDPTICRRIEQLDELRARLFTSLLQGIPA